MSLAKPRSQKPKRNWKTAKCREKNDATISARSILSEPTWEPPARLNWPSPTTRTSTFTRLARTGTKNLPESRRRSPCSTPRTTTWTTAWAASIPRTERLKRRWIFPNDIGDAAIQLSRQLDLPPPIAGILCARGMADAAAASDFLTPNLARLHDPFQLRDMDRALQRLLLAIQRSEKIQVHGDYDVDGVTSTVILKTAIGIAGGCASFSIPHRLRDGYGIRDAAVDRAASEGVTLIVSVDTGIRAKAAVDRARELGIDVIITDHHLPEEALPPACAVLNPNRRDCCYPEKHLCG